MNREDQKLLRSVGISEEAIARSEQIAQLTPEQILKLGAKMKIKMNGSKVDWSLPSSSASNRVTEEEWEALRLTYGSEAVSWMKREYAARYKSETPEKVILRCIVKLAEEKRKQLKENNPVYLGINRALGLEE